MLSSEIASIFHRRQHFLEHRFNGQGDKQWPINNAVRWHWPYFMPFNLGWYFDAQCPATPEHTGGFHALFKDGGGENTSCLTEVTSLPKPPKDINKNTVATCWLIFFNFYYYYYFYCTVEIYFFIFTETLWMLSVSLTTAVDSGAHALKLNCEMLWQGTKKAPATYSQCTMGNGVCTWVWVQLTVNTDILHCTNTVYWFIQQQCGHFDVACSM